jgi:hypothetical protein
MSSNSLCWRAWITGCRCGWRSSPDARMVAWVLRPIPSEKPSPWLYGNRPICRGLCDIVSKVRTGCSGTDRASGPRTRAQRSGAFRPSVSFALRNDRRVSESVARGTFPRCAHRAKFALGQKPLRARTNLSRGPPLRCPARSPFMDVASRHDLRTSEEGEVGV